MPADACQFNSGPDVARIFVMRLRFARVVPMIRVDSYITGRGEMSGRLLGLVRVAHGEGEEFDIRELATFLNDAVLLAPSFLLTETVTWSQGDGDSFDVTLGNVGHAVTARVLVDGRGAPQGFSTTDRYANLPEGLTRAESQYRWASSASAGRTPPREARGRRATPRRWSRKYTKLVLQPSRSAISAAV